MVKGKKATTGGLYHAFPIRGKRGEELTTPIIMILLLDIMVFIILLLFVVQASSGALTYENVYAKEIAFFIDSARPGTDVSIDFSNAIQIAEKNGLKDDALKNLVTIDKKNNLVKVSLRGQAGKSMQFFSDYPICVAGMEGDKFILRIREVCDNV